MAKYVRLSKSLKDRGILIKPEEVYDNIDDKDIDHYTSAYYYNDEQYKQFKKSGTVASITDVKTDKIWFDLDSKTDPEMARTDSLELIQRLKDYGIEESNIEIYFSGNKGYHIVVKTNRMLTPEQVTSIAINKFGKDISTLDKTVYNASRIFRVPYTKHAVSGLYKSPLDFETLKTKTTDEIKVIASDYENLPGLPETEPVDIKDEPLVIPKKERIKDAKVTNNIDWTRKPKHWRDYKWALLQAVGLKASERSTAMIILASSCRAIGYDEDMTRGLLTSFDRKYSSVTKQEENPEEIENKLGSVFSTKWTGGQYSPEENEWLAEYCERIGLKRDKSKLLHLSDINDQFKDYVKHIDENTIKTGIAKLDKEVPITIGMNLGIVGAASSGKTALALSILQNTSEAGVVSVMASLDMHRNRLFEKLLYKVSGGISREELYDIYQNDREQELFDKVKAQFGNVYFYDRSSPTVADIREYTEQIEYQTGKKVKLVMIDYFERVNSDISEDTAASKKVSGELQDFINDMNVAMITLVQPNKMSLASGPDCEIKSYTAIKGSSFLYQSFRSIIAIWRPFFSPSMKHMDKFLEMGILKNDLGELNKFIFSWTGKTGEIKDPSVEELEQYAAFMSQKNHEKTEEDGNGWN